jgi:hypothetical protein
MPFVACPGCGNKTYSIRIHLVRADCLVCGARLLSPSVAVPAAFRPPRRGRPLNEGKPRH